LFVMFTVDVSVVVTLFCTLLPIDGLGTLPVLLFQYPYFTAQSPYVDLGHRVRNIDFPSPDIYVFPLGSHTFWEIPAVSKLH